MKSSFFTLALIAALAGARPLIRRQTNQSNDIQNGNCKSTTFIFARGSTEQGNVGDLVGAPLCGMLKNATNGDMACQGVGGQYKATLLSNTNQNGTDPGSTQEAINTIRQTISKCPNSNIIAGGYSQGSAVISTAMQALNPDEANKVKAIVFYGYTKNQQTNGMLPGYPPNQLKVFCRPDDGVCKGNLDVTIGHLSYGQDGTVPQGAAFLLNTGSVKGANVASVNTGNQANNGGDVTTTLGVGNLGLGTLETGITQLVNGQN